MSCLCAYCKQPYQMDLMVPDSLWDKIKPTDGELLCQSCIVLELEDLLGYCAFKLEEIT